MAGGCARFFLAVFNLVDLLLGLTLIALGVIAHLTLNHFTSLVGEINAVSIVLIIVGCVVTIISLLGLCGACRNSRCLLVLFCVFTVLVLLFQVAIITVSFLAKDKVEDGVYEVLSREVNDYNAADTTTIPTQIWDYIQREFECCGVHGHTDWSDNEYFKNITSIPDSCCVHPTSKCGMNKLTMKPNNEQFYSKGCIDGVEDYMTSNVVTFASVLIVAAVTLLFKFFLATYLLDMRKRRAASRSMLKQNIDFDANTVSKEKSGKTDSFSYVKFQ